MSKIRFQLGDTPNKYDADADDSESMLSIVKEASEHLMPGFKGHKVGLTDTDNNVIEQWDDQTVKDFVKKNGDMVRLISTYLLG